MTTHDLFFYGTLVHPKILARVIGRTTLKTCDALLPNHTRHHIIGEDYPAVVSASLGRAILARDLSEQEARVQGSLVKGLTTEDLAYLDEFEGDEYIRSQVSVIPSLDPSVPSVQAETYIWIAPASRLQPSLWSFDDFLKSSAHRWVGESGENNEYYGEVDRRRAMGGQITPTNNVEKVPAAAAAAPVSAEAGFESFGKAFGKKYWQFEEGYRNLNHGSYGAAPRPVIEAFRNHQDASNSNPDRFLKVTYGPELTRLRGRLSELVNCDSSDLVMVPNATSGVNTVLRGLTTQWQKHDVLLCFDTTIYNACSASLQHIVDSHPHLSLSTLSVPISYPITDASILTALESTISNYEADPKSLGKIRLALFDAISSNPGVVVPWEKIVDVCQKHDIISLVDAAHQIGQLPVDLKKVQPDFWLSNCHKWLMAHRGAAVLYVSKKHQPYIHSIPNGHFYRTSPITSQDFQNEFDWNGTIDYSVYLSIHAALDFRKNVCGGEERITKYCHALAVEGGQLVAKGLGTKVMKNVEDGQGQLIANMVNVLLPLDLEESPTLTQVEFLASLTGKLQWMMKQQLSNGVTFVPFFIHANQPWCRISAQVYNDLTDFEFCVPYLLELCAKVNTGAWKQ